MAVVFLLNPGHSETHLFYSFTFACFIKELHLWERGEARGGGGGGGEDIK